MKRIITILLAVIMMASTLVLVGCGDNNAPADGGNTDSATVADLAKVKENGKIVVGMECAYAPYNWQQADENEFTTPIAGGLYADGYDIQIAKRIAADLGAELVVKPIEWDGLIPALNSGDIDMIIAGMSPTEERKLSIDFSDTYFDSNLVIVVKGDSAYAGATSLSDFSGAKIAAQLNTFHEKVINQIEGVDQQTSLADFAALIQALESGAIDGYVCEKPGAVSAVAAHEDFTYVEFADGEGFTCDPAESSISVGLRKGSDLTAKVNETLATISKNQREATMDAAIARQPAGE